MPVAGDNANRRVGMPAPHGVRMWWADQFVHARPALFIGVVCE